MSLIFQKPPFNYQYQVGLTNLVDVNGDVIAKTGILADNLYRTLIIRGNAFALDGQMATLLLAGTKQQPANTIGIVLRVNGVEVWNINTGVNGALRAWKMFTWLLRVGSLLACYSEMYPSMPEDSTVEEQISPFVTRKLVSPVDFTADITIELRVSINGAGDAFTSNFAHLSIL